MEDFVTFEQAQKLKELGFDWECYKFYATQTYCEGNNQFFFDTICTGDLIDSPKYKEDENDGWIPDEEWCVAAPTLAQAQKWLREIKNISVEPVSCGYNDNMSNNIVWSSFICSLKDKLGFDQTADFDTYEQALSAGIESVIELLKQQSSGNQD